MLLFEGRYREALLAGTKTATLRHWKHRLVREGQLVRTNLKGIWLHIGTIRSVTPAEITDTQARADGFANRAALLAALTARYGTLPDSLRLVRFTLHRPTA